MAAVVDGSHPVEQVNWTTGSETLTRHGLSLPTEAQWEYGCRGTTSTAYWFDFADLKDFANVADATAKRVGTSWTCEAWADGHVIHAPVGAFGANRFGLHDVHGNLWEWCQDTYGNTSNRVARGGSFNNVAVYAVGLPRQIHLRTAPTSSACVPPSSSRSDVSTSPNARTGFGRTQLAVQVTRGVDSVARIVEVPSISWRSDAILQPRANAGTIDSLVLRHRQTRRSREAVCVPLKNHLPRFAQSMAGRLGFL